jgi:glyoxylase-like metal-dependent hydrolase (beta-lactamase superfamily II)
MSEMKIIEMSVGQVQTNCYLAYHEDTREGIIVDPGDNAIGIMARIQKENILPVAILLTHGHFDHMLAATKLKEQYNIPIYAHEKEKAVLLDPEANLTGSWLNHPIQVEADYYVKDHEILHLAGFDLEVIHTPGHTIGGVCYYVADEKVLFAGDTLFYRSFGRYDLLTASPEMLLDSLVNRLFVLPDDVKAYPGHGQSTVIGEEKVKNPAARYRA